MYNKHEDDQRPDAILELGQDLTMNMTVRQHAEDGTVTVLAEQNVGDAFDPGFLPALIDLLDPHLGARAPFWPSKGGPGHRVLDPMGGLTSQQLTEKVKKLREAGVRRLRSI